MKALKVLTICTLLGAALAVHAQNKTVKVGFLSTLSGPTAAIGTDVRDGLQLFLKSKGGKLGGLPAELIITDDALSTDTAKQNTERLLKREKVDFITGGVFAAVYLPVLPEILAAKTFYLGSNGGPQDYAGVKCNPYYFSVAFQNEDLSPGIASFMDKRGFKSIYLVATAGAGGREVLNGFKRHYKGKYEEMYTKLGQVDYAAELATIRAAKPEAVFAFLPGGMGVSFMKQFVGAGLSKDTQVFVPGYNADEDSLRPLGETLLGTMNTSHWAHDLDNAANKRFVQDFQAEYKRLPSMYAAQGYDVGQLMDAATRDVKGRLSDKDALRKALEAANFESVRGKFKFNKNHMPIHDIYMRVVTKDAQGRVTNKTLTTVAKQQSDPFASECQMSR
ncbi:MAG: ABC transporter substrate-binding protein [Pseudomonadota bacterium]